MAMIPRVETSTRKVGIMPQLHYARSIAGEVGREIGSAGRAVSGALLRINQAMEAEDRRDAEYNLALADNFFKNAAIGQDVVDAQTGEKRFIPGRLQRTYKEMEAEGTDSVKTTRGIIADMKEQEWYKKMKPSVRRHFDRKIAFREDAWIRHAGENDIRLRHNARVEKTKEYIALNAQGVQSTYGLPTSTFEDAATAAAFRNTMYLEESAILNEEDFDGVAVTAMDLKKAFDSIKWNKGVTEEYKRGVYNRMLKGVHEFEINRLTALTSAAAKGEMLGAMSPEECLSTAEGMIDAMREIELDGINPATGKPTELMTEAQAAALRGEIGTARERLQSIRDGERRKRQNEALKKHETVLAKERMKIIDPETAGESTISVSSYKNALEKDTSLDPIQKAKVLDQVATLENYRKSYFEELEKHKAEVAEQYDKHNSQYGFFTEGGKNADGSTKWVFNPAKSFPKTTTAYAEKRFADESSIWQDTNTAQAELEAAKLTGHISAGFYKNRLAHLHTMQDEKARMAWEKIYPTIKELKESGYGKSELSPSETKARKKGKVPEAIWAKRGVAGSPVDWLKDSLEYNGGEDYENGTEEFIPLDVLTEVEKTVQRLARNGVDPTEAIRQLIAPTIERGIRMRITERLKDETYFNAVVRRHRLESGYYGNMRTKTQSYLHNRTEKSYAKTTDSNKDEQ